ncbi:transmembrane amino acid transporter protein-domain-containing protein [Dactylonectria macrodidyma]|uniref:Transmembrane amino acid transporter protein-domain-containing protein n=1 Tax=Dactylonectria macrodidyma TaxID=307937 RepID=A0A9P9FR40_9HYPO|nr:transmembrane amino acid transporter protein-domain-containing protein [Dactylonectria macrodidyma]
MSDSEKYQSDSKALGQQELQTGDVYDDPSHAHDAVFGTITEDGPNYRDVGWLGTVALMLKTQIGLGVLSIPAAFDTLGIVPGIICLCVIAAVTTWSDYMIGVFKLKHREVYNIDDAGQLMFGRIGREFFAVAFVLFWIFVAGSGMLSVSIGLNAVSHHGTCTAAFVAIAAIISFSLSSIRTLGRLTWLAWVGVGAILTAIMIVTIAVGIQDRPSAAPTTGHWESDFKIIGSPTFTKAISAISSIVFSYAGTPAFFSIASEMRDPRLYTRSLMCCQATVTIVYIVIGCVVYYFCGSYVSSPALGSAGPMVKKVAYGFALPGLIVSTTLLSHVAAKYIFVRALRNSKHLTANTMQHWGSWLGCTFFIMIAAYCIASGIPVFGGLVSLIGAFLGTVLSFQPYGCMWLYDNWSAGKDERSLRWCLMVAWSVFVIVSGMFLMIGGTYGSIVDIIDSYKASGGSAAWSCADNSGSV